MGITPSRPTRSMLRLTTRPRLEIRSPGLILIGGRLVAVKARIDGKPEFTHRRGESLIGNVLHQCAVGLLEAPGSAETAAERLRVSLVKKAGLFTMLVFDLQCQIMSCSMANFSAQGSTASDPPLEPGALTGDEINVRTSYRM